MNNLNRFVGLTIALSMTLCLVMGSVGHADLVAHWKLDEGSGTTFADSVGNNDGFLLGGGGSIPVWSDDTPPTGFVNPHSLLFDAAGQTYVDTLFEGIGGAEPRTISAWVKTDSTASQSIVSYGARDANGRKWHFRINPDGDPRVPGAVRTEAQGGNQTGETNIADGQWHHVVSLFPGITGDNDEVIHFVDGVEELGTGTTDEPIDTGIGGGFPLVSIGARQQTPPAFESFMDGWIDDVRIYDRALTDGEITGLGTAPTADGLVAHWAFDDGPGSTTATEAVAGNDGTLAFVDASSTVNWVQEGPPGGPNVSAEFIGDQDTSFISTPYEGVVGTDARSIAAWIKTTDTNAAIINWGTNGAGQKWTVRVQDGQNGDGRLRLEVNGGNVVGETFVADGNWHHVAVAWEADADPDVLDTDLYVDGVLQGFRGSAGEPMDTGNLQTVRIGNDFNGGRQMNGLMSDVRVYDHALTQEEVMGLSGGPAPGSELLLHYTFEDTTGGGTMVPDQSIYGLDGTMVGDARLTGPGGGIVGGALELDGDDDFLNSGDVQQFDSPGRFTVSMWFNRRAETFDATNHGTNNVLIAQSSVPDNDNLEIGTLVGDVQLYIDAQQADGPENPVVPTDVLDETWQHLVLTYDEDEDIEAMLYLDGELVMEDDRWGGFLVSSATSPLTFGAARPDRADPWGELDGFIDEIQIYNRAITQDEVLQLLNDPGSTLVGDLVAELQAGDANMDYEFNQLDLVQVQIAAKYLTGQAATWGEGDWDAAPGGEPGNPPQGNGTFDQLDIIAALGAGTYLQGPYAAIAKGGTAGDSQTSIIYNPDTGELGVDAPAGTDLTSINIDSAAGVFTGDPAQNLGGSFDNDADNNIFKATFGSSFGSLSFGNVAQTGLSEDFVANDLTAVGSLAGGGDLGAVDLIYVPEPSALVLFGLGVAGMLLTRSRRRA